MQVGAVFAALPDSVEASSDFAAAEAKAVQRVQRVADRRKLFMAEGVQVAKEEIVRSAQLFSILTSI